MPIEWDVVTPFNHERAKECAVSTELFDISLTLAMLEKVTKGKVDASSHLRFYRLNAWGGKPFARDEAGNRVNVAHSVPPLDASRRQLYQASFVQIFEADRQMTPGFALR